MYDTEDGTKNYLVSGGVLQGSALGPLLWNIMYDGVLRLRLPENAKIIDFADDLAVVVTVKYTEEALPPFLVVSFCISRLLVAHRLCVQNLVEFGSRASIFIFLTLPPCLVVYFCIIS